MVFTELLHNLALIMVMGVIYSFIYRKLEYDSLMFRAASGVLFGVIALLGMNLSFTLMPGIIFDGRSVILAVAGLFGGLVPALIASVMAAFYRVWIGGGGVITGVLVIVSSAGLGVAYNALRRRRNIPYRMHHFYIFGLLVHINMVLLMATLPGSSRLIVFETIALPVLALFPIATVLISMLLADTEQRIEDEKALRESEHRLRSVIAGMPVMLNAYNENGTIIAWNAECAAVTGYNTDEIIGKPEATMLLYGNGADAMPVSQSSTGKAVIRNSERRITAKNGTVKTLLWSSLSELFPIPGWHSWGIGVDITERKNHESRIEAALREKEVLLKEIHHRVKNNMQIISSLMNLQLRKMKDGKSREMAADTVRRIQSMALVHEMLYHSGDLAEIDFKQYTARLVSEISGA
ncbi:MAG TPA: PAS domain S-box protein [Spirochaetes bacterium]|nr:PAS domain S-box protein [Spirochaetota bacterium]